MNSYVFRLLLIAPCLLFSFGAFISSENSFLNSEKQRSLDVLIRLNGQITELIKLVEENNWKQAKAQLKTAKLNYKSAEYLLEYYHHSAINTFINGAPLPKIEQKVADLRIIEPQGFQRLEELLYTEKPSSSEAKKVLRDFVDHLKPILNYHPRLSMYDRHVLEALRFQLIRISALELTGFENPMNTNLTLEETEAAFIGMKNAAIHYAMQISEVKANQVKYLFEKGQQMLEEGSFDSFDRLTFIKDVSDPLFKLLLEIHVSSGIETLNEVNHAPIAVNYSAKSLFDEQLLNKAFFLSSDEHSLAEARVKLGKTLFFDPALSKANTLSCASCHHPDKAFTDGKAKSLSNDLKAEVDRNAPTLMNSVYAGSYFHDLRADRLEKQTEHVMVSPLEFNIKPLELANKLKESEEYIQLFEEAYNTEKDPIKPHRIESALAAYVASLTSWNSRFDKYIRNESDELNASEKNGFNLFMGKASCGTCHFAPNFNGIVPPFYDDTESEVLGITTNADSNQLTLDQDLGRYSNGKKAEETPHFKHSIKTPTVRNIELTGPYFHNGGFQTLEEVMWFYNNGGGLGLGLDVPNQTLPPDALGLRKGEIEDIIAFMKSLTDVSNFQEIPTSLPSFGQNSELNNRLPNTY